MMAAPGMMPPLQLSMGSSAASESYGGSASGGGMGAINQGDWIIQRTGKGNNSAVPSSQQNWLLLAAVAAGAWFLARR